MKPGPPSPIHSGAHAAPGLASRRSRSPPPFLPNSHIRAGRQWRRCTAHASRAAVRATGSGRAGSPDPHRVNAGQRCGQRQRCRRRGAGGWVPWSPTALTQGGGAGSVREQGSGAGGAEREGGFPGAPPR
ncbi:hypothetical protein B0H14DRAFT_3536654 [Mycena olivaceomarginata]|nr:hypothetical protein B0H14DRAFT_3536654 [Mycena olivaceomarginata]